MSLVTCCLFTEIALRVKRHITCTAWLLTLLVLVLVGCGSSTAGAVATATASPSPMATTSASPPPLPKPTFFDSLHSNTHGWPTFKGHCEFANGGMQISDAVCALPFFDAENGALSVDAKLTAGDRNNPFGLVWRATNNNLYEFDITANGDWGFYKSVGGAYTALDTDTITSYAIHQGFAVVNTLMVIFRGSKFEYFVNGVKLGESTDTSLTSGVIGMAVNNGGTTVFNNFAYFE
jgi:hypothetical protein